MQNVVDAHVGGLEAAQTLFVGCIHDGVDGEPANIAAPNSYAAVTASCR
jgi:hypothetical protein